MTTEHPKPANPADSLRKAAATIQTLKARLARLETRDHEPIAIVGMACRFPGGVDTPDALWRLLQAGTDTVGDIPSDRWDVDGFYDPDPEAPGKMSTRAGAFLRDVDRFDPGFFGITPREAKALDPQHRLLLEVSWEALEDAGVVPADLVDTRTGVFVGIGESDYGQLSTNLDAVSAYTGLGTASAFSAGRLSYVLGLQGPSLALDTACSSSLVALHLGCMSLRAGESQMALVGGVSLILSPLSYVFLSRSRALSPDGRCKTFSAHADGYGRGEGCAMLVLKRLSDAQRAGDRIWGVVRGSAVAHDGTSSGLTAPNGTSQQLVLREALRAANLSGDDIDYIEAHGTGTPLGDPIEVEALAAVYGARQEPLRIGSIKTNVGHLETASGVAGVMKAVLAIHHGELPAHLHAGELNPHIPWAELPIRVTSQAEPWPRARELRRAGVSSFGMSGTNAHVILEQAPPPPPAAAPSVVATRPAELLTLSARSEASLREQARRLAEHLRAHPSFELPAIAHALATRRTHLPQRLAARVADRDAALAVLDAFASGAAAPGSVTGRIGQSTPRQAWLFTGQGSQHAGMGHALDAHEPVFRAVIDRAAAVLDGVCHVPLRAVLFPADGAATPIDQTAHTQPALFALEVALAELWRSWGMRPSVVIGHSVGEYAAACVAGVFSLEDGLRLIAARGRLMQALAEPGAMVAIAAPEARVAAAVAPYAATVSIAAVNGPEAVVISGAEADVLAIAAHFSADGVRTRRLTVSHAFHSPLMAPMLDDFRRVAESITYARPRLPLVGNLDGRLAGDAVTRPDYWVRHVREPVRFADGVATLRAQGVTAALEIGPQPVLVGLAAACAPDAEVAWLPSLRPDRDPYETMLDTAARLHVAGATIDGRGLAGSRAPAAIPLPPYAFARERYWLDAPATLGGHETHDTSAALAGPAGSFLLSGRPLPVPGDELHQVLLLGVRHQPYLADHIVHGQLVVAGAIHLAIVLAVAFDRLGAQQVTLSDVQFVRPLFIPDEARVHIVLRPDAETGRYRFTVATAAAADDVAAPTTWHVHCEGWLATSVAPPSLGRTLADARAANTTPVSVQAVYDQIAAFSMIWGPSWQGLRSAFASASSALVELAPAADGDAPQGPMHPRLIDNGIGSASAVAVAHADLIGQEHDAPLPYALGALRLYRPPTGPLWCLNQARTQIDEASEAVVGDLVWWDEHGDVVVEIEAFASKRGRKDAFLSLSESAVRPPFHALAWQALPPVTPSPLTGRWAVLGDDPTMVDALARALADAGAEVVTEAAATVAGVVCWWNASSSGAAAATSAAIAAMSLVQSLIGLAPAPRLVWATASAMSTDGAPARELSTSTLWGLGRAVASEHPDLRLRLIEVSPALASDAAARAIAGELAATDDEAQVVLAAGERVGARLARVPAGAASDAPFVSEGGTVLITGGLGGIGLALARGLVSSAGVRHLVLVGRRAPTDGATAIIDELRAQGATVEVAAADVADRDALAAVLAALPTAHPLRAIVHAAGVLDDGVLAHQTAERFERVLAPKVAGAWHLHELTADLALERFVLCSSATTFLGAAAQSNYAAANAFLDALAAHRRAAGLAATSVAWGPWSEVGMASNMGAPERARLSRLGLGWIDPVQGVAFLRAAVEQPSAMVAALPLDLAKLRRAFAHTDAPSILRVLVGERTQRGAEAQALEARLRRLPPRARARALEDVLRADLRAVMGVVDVATDQPLRELGLDSLMAVELRNGLAAKLGRSLPATLLYDHPTLEALAAYLLEHVLDVDGEGATTASTSSAPAPLAAGEAIAIIGMACRYPGGVTDPESFWSLLERGGDAITEIPPDRWDVDTLYDPDPDAAGKMWNREGGFISDVDKFDADFFGISAREAVDMDPQQRLLLEVSWEAIERAGIAPSALMGRSVGVFVGAMSFDYAHIREKRLDALTGYVVTGNGGSIAAGRISYTLGLKGPCVTIDTACSSSLVTLHYACQSLRLGECETALAGGVTLTLTPAMHVEFSRLRVSSPEGRCKSFGAKADGAGWSEGCGMVLLKPLAAARRDGDPILAVIRGSAVNQDGRSQGLTAPNGPAQEAVISRALAVAGVAPAEIDYVECHGTGTPLGDPIEVQALAAVLGRGRTAPAVIGSVKSNIGHAQAAAGIAGVIKTVLSLQHELIPPSLHADPLSPHVPWSELPLQVATAARPWHKNGRPRRAGVSSFGISGTNAHVVLEEAPSLPPAAEPVASDDAPASHVVCVSARSADALRAQAERLADHLRAHPDLALADVAHALGTDRSHFAHRLVVRAADRDAAIAGLDAHATSTATPAVIAGQARGRAPRIAFCYTGQGSQYAPLARRLYQAEPVFRAALDRCAAGLERELALPLAEVLWPSSDGPLAIDRTANTQPALFAIGYALTALWRSWGIEPAAVIGHSIGEYAAACAAGVFSLEDGLRLVAARGRLMEALSAEGAMVSVAADEARVAAAVAPHAATISIAAVNAADQIVIAGAAADVLAIAEQLSAEGVRTRRLTVSHAFHSPLMDPMLDDFRRVVASIELAPPQLPLVSNLHGGLAGDEVADPDYWVRHVRAPVRFADGVATLGRQDLDAVIELGPRPTLIAMAAAALPDAPITWLPSLRADHDDVDVAHETLARLYVAGAELDWDGVAAGRATRKVALPTYAFARRRHWLARTVLDELREDARNGAVERNLYALRWRELPGAAASIDVSGHWLVCVDEGDIAAALVAALEQAGARVTRVDSDAATLTSLLGTPGNDVRGVVCAWALTNGWAGGAPRGLTRVLHALQATLAADSAARFVVLTRGAVATTADELVDPAQSAVWGLGRVAALEHAARWGGLVDLPTGPLDERHVPALLAAVTAGAAGDPEDQRALRDGGSVRVPRLAPMTVRPASEPWTVRDTVLVTGGLGALGLRVATWAVERGAAHVVLTSRRGAATEGAAEAAARLEALGARVSIIAADSGDRDAMCALIAQLDADAAPLRAVFHTAGVADDAAVRQLDDAELARVFAGKARGAELLDELLGERELDAFVSFASIAGVWGSARQASYAAANAFLDGLGARRRHAGRVATTIDFGPWSGDGMAAEIAGLLRRRGVEPLDAATMLAALERLLATSTDTAVVAGVDWARFRALVELERTRPLFTELPGAPAAATAEPTAAPASQLLRTLRRLDAAARRPHVQTWLRDVVAAVLGRADADGVDVRTGFFDLGLDSLMALELRRRVQAELGITLSATAAFNHPNVEALAGHLLDELGLPLDNDGAPAIAAPAAAAWNEPIAIVGIGCRMPGAGDGPAAFWQLLDGEGDGVRDVPADRWDIDAYYDPDPRAEGKTYTRRGAFIDGHDRFDAEFFGIAPRDAAAMDPQHRLLLETAWAALEDAGVVPGRLAETRTGIFVGIGEAEYLHVLPRDLESVSAYTGMGTSPSFSAGRLSYVLGLQGPSMAVDTACSSSLVALHLACQSLRAGESQLALAGGVSLMLSPEGLVFRARIGALSADGRCKTFGADADGYVRGEGCGVLVLKRLSDARAAGDRIWAVVRGSAVAHDGASSGITVPNGRSQEQVLRDALASAGVRADEVDYVEAHGTGTPLGDPIEVEALAAVYGHARGDAPALRIGSVKTNVGHLEAAAGVAGLIKTVLALHHERIPRHLNVDRLSPHIPWATIPVEVATVATPWPVSARPRRAGVSAFGLSGTNAHVVLEEAPADPATETTPAGDARTAHLFALTARSPAALGELAGRIADHLRAHPKLSPGDVAHTLGTRREPMAHRLAFVAGDSASAADTLAAFAADGRAANALTGRATRPPRVAFLYPGQGPQFAQMARQLHATEPVFRAVMERCSAALAGELERPLLELVYPAGDDELPAPQGVSQPALFAVQVALSALWRSWGIEPALLIGHSAGEYAAACVAGVFSVEDGVRLMAARGRLMDGVPEDGAMVSVVATEAQVTERLAPFAELVSIAAINGPETVVIGGPQSAVMAAAAALESAGLRIKRLRISAASHTVLMDPMLDGLARVLESASFQPARLPCVSCVDGALAGARMSDPAYWVRHVRQPVRFADGVVTLAGAGIDVVVEISPRPTLLGTAASVVPDAPIAWLPSLVPARGDHEAMLDALARLHVAGAPIDWRGLDDTRPRHAVALPGYPFARTRHWVTSSAARPTARRAAGGHAVLGAPLRLSIAHGPRIWEQPLEFSAVPTARALELGAALAVEHLGAGACVALRDVTFDEDAGNANASRTLQAALAPGGTGTSTFSLASAVADDTGDAWHVHAHGAIAPADALPAAPSLSRADALARCPQRSSGDEIYRRLARAWVETAPEDRVVQVAWSRQGELVAELDLSASDDLVERRRRALHAAVHLVHLIAGKDDGTSAITLASAGTLSLAASLPATVWAHAAHRGDGDERVVDVALHADDGAAVLVLRDVGLRSRPIAAGSVQAVHARFLTDGHPAIVAQLGAQLADVLGKVLSVDPAALDLDGAWTSYGLDSLMELEVIRRMERKVGVSLRLTKLPADEATSPPTDASAAPRTLRSEAVRIALLLHKTAYAATPASTPAPDALVEHVVSLAWDDAVPAAYRDAFGESSSARSCLATLASGITLDVYTVGAGRPVVLLPPIISSALIWKYQVEALAADHHVIIPNYPGWGRSSFRARDIAPERLASQLLAVLDALGVDQPAHLVGWSLGGMVAQLVARHAPARVRSLSLVNTTARLDELDTIENAQRMLRELKADIDRGLAELPVSQADEVRRLIVAASASSDRSVDMYYLGAVLRFDSRTILGGIRAPTLVVQGRRDPIATREVGDFLHRQIPGARYVESNAGHYVPLHDPDHLNRSLLDFLGHAPLPRLV